MCIFHCAVQHCTTHNLLSLPPDCGTSWTLPFVILESCPVRRDADELVTGGFVRVVRLRTVGPRRAAGLWLCPFFF